jgi:hypothetical protein
MVMSVYFSTILNFWGNFCVTWSQAWNPSDAGSIVIEAHYLKIRKEFRIPLSEVAAWMTYRLPPQNPRSKQPEHQAVTQTRSLTGIQTKPRFKVLFSPILIAHRMINGAIPIKELFIRLKGH